MSYFTDIKLGNYKVLVDKKILEDLGENWLNEVKEDYNGEVEEYLSENTDYDMRTFINYHTLEKQIIIYEKIDKYHRVSINKNYEESLIEIIEDEDFSLYILQSINYEFDIEENYKVKI